MHSSAWVWVWIASKLGAILSASQWELSHVVSCLTKHDPKTKAWNELKCYQSHVRNSAFLKREQKLTWVPRGSPGRWGGNAGSDSRSYLQGSGCGTHCSDLWWRNWREGWVSNTRCMGKMAKSKVFLCVFAMGKWLKWCYTTGFIINDINAVSYLSESYLSYLGDGHVKLDGHHWKHNLRQDFRSDNRRILRFE